MVQWLYIIHLHAEDVLLDVVREGLELVTSVHGRWDREHYKIISEDRKLMSYMVHTFVQLLQGQSFGFGQKQQDQDKSYHIPARVPAERALRRESLEQSRESDGDDKVEEPQQSRR